MSSPDYLNEIERQMIDSLRTAFAGAKIFIQFPETVDLAEAFLAKKPIIVLELIGCGTEQQLFGQSGTFGGTVGNVEIYGGVYRIHVILDKQCEMTPDSIIYKENRLLKWILLHISNTIQDMTFDETKVEVMERHLRAWEDTGYVADLEWWGASAVLWVSFKNYRT